MIGRLLVGIVKGLVVGGLVGFGLLKLGMVAPTALIAYLAAAVTGVLIGLVAGKPIWAKDAKIEAGMKAGVGALLGLGLMFAARRWLTMGVPAPVLSLLSPLKEGEAAPALGTYAVTSLAGVAGVLGGFYDADNTPEPADKATASADAGAGKKRIAEEASAEEEEPSEEEAAEEPEKKAKK